MATIAGMDLGYGSQVKLVRTNYLVIRVGNGVTAATTINLTAAANFLSIVQNKFHGQVCRPDYIVVSGSTGSGGSYSFTNADLHPNVIANTSTLPSGASTAATAPGAVPLAGPSQSALAQASGLPAEANTAAENLGNPKVQAILNVGVIEFTANTLASGAVVEGVGTAADASQLAHANLLLSAAADIDTNGDPIRLADLDAAFTDALAALTAAATVDMTDANLLADFVEVGNASGTTATELTDVTFAGTNSCALVSAVALVTV